MDRRKTIWKKQTVEKWEHRCHERMPYYCREMMSDNIVGIKVVRLGVRIEINEGEEEYMACLEDNNVSDGFVGRKRKM